ncbi:MAG: ThuA domain-containing protein [Dehalococcoidia bacterium]
MKTLLITGGNHPFEETTPVLEKLLIQNNNYVLVTESADELNFKDFEFDVIVMNSLRQAKYKNDFNENQKKNLMKLISNGVGLVSIHISAASCPDWKEMKNITGGGWVTNGKSWHPPIGWFKVYITDEQHPIVKGVKEFWTYDECYCELDKKDNISTFISGKVNNVQMPIGWSSNYGKGMISNISLGHSGISQENPMFQRIVLNSLKFVNKKKISKI